MRFIRKAFPGFELSHKPYELVILRTMLSLGKGSRHFVSAPRPSPKPKCTGPSMRAP
jgi:hypothetical protein